MAVPRVVVKNHFRQLGNDYERATKKALGRTAGVVMATARGAPSRYDIGSIQASVKATPVHKWRSGWRLIVWASDFRAGFFEFGTYRGRRRKLKRPRKAGGQARYDAGARGVQAQRFMAKANRVGKAALLQNVKREFGGH